MALKEQLVVSLRTPLAAQAGAGSPLAEAPRERSRIRPVIVFVVLIALAAVVWRYLAPTESAPLSMPTTPSVAATASTTVASSQETKVTDIIARVGALIELPQGETPTIATVTDPSKLQDQAFFAHAKKGDIVLMYTAAREAYLFDPEAGKLVAVAPITASDATSTAPLKTSTPPLKAKSAP